MPKRIDHVAIIVHNIEQALAFYQDTLGIRCASLFYPWVAPGEARSN